MRLLWLVLIILLNVPAFAQSSGCTDPQATNFDSIATQNNGSCLYADELYTPALVNTLPTSLGEISGLIYFDQKLLALNDGGGGNLLYFLDTINGAIVQTITVAGATNLDWEDLAQDSGYVYIGDCGNNNNGNRTNLRIYRIAKDQFAHTGNFTIPASAVETINFSYPDQTDFTPTGANNTKYDCEAITVSGGKLHLFTKNWVGAYSVHYSLPLQAGTFTATRLDSLNTSGMLLTGVDAGGYDEVMFTAYNKTGGVAMYLVFGFNDADSLFVQGNKRKINLPTVITSGQVESICFVNAAHGFIANENFSQLIFNVKAKLNRFSSWQWLLDYYKVNQRPFATQGMVRYNSDLNQYEIFTGASWEAMN